MSGNNHNLPDFFIIGGMKCATSTLHDQLAQIGSVFMSDPKEIYFFSDDPVYSNGLDWYRSLFAAAEPGQLRGESTTHYAKFPTYPETINRIKQAGLGDSKFIYVVRHPIDRLVSQYIHEWSQRVISCDINAALDSNPELVQYSDYAYQLNHYLDAFPKENTLIVFFEALRDDPQRVFEAVCQFLEIDGPVSWDFELGASNVSSERVRKFPLYSLLIDSKPMAWLRQNLVPKSVRNRIREGLTMKKRPVLSDASLGRLEPMFDDKLKQFGNLLGIELNLKNYTDVSKNVAVTKAK